MEVRKSLWFRFNANKQVVSQVMAYSILNTDHDPSACCQVPQYSHAEAKHCYCHFRGYRSARMDLDKKQMKYVVSEHFPDMFTINILWLVRFVDQHFLYMSICNIKYSR